MKKFFALLLALVMVLSLVACGDKKTDDNQDANNTDDQQGETTTYTNPDDIDDNMTSEDGKYEVAFVTDVGQLKDKSFNQGTFDGVKLYAANNGLSYKYYQPANGDQATDDDRYDAMKAAVDCGAKVIAADDAVDFDFNAIKHTLAQEIAADPAKVDAALDLLMVIKYLERIGDHAVNVAEWVQFVRTGRYKDESMF